MKTKTKTKTKKKTKTRMKIKTKAKTKTKMKTKMDLRFFFQFAFHFRFCFCFCFLKVFTFLLTPRGWRSHRRSTGSKLAQKWHSIFVNSTWPRGAIAPRNMAPLVKNQNYHFKLKFATQTMPNDYAKFIDAVQFFRVRLEILFSGQIQFIW